MVCVMLASGVLLLAAMGCHSSRRSLAWESVGRANLRTQELRLMEGGRDQSARLALHVKPYEADVPERLRADLTHGRDWLCLVEPTELSFAGVDLVRRQAVFRPNSATVFSSRVELIVCPYASTILPVSSVFM